MEQLGSQDLAFSRDGRFLASCDAFVWIWQVANGKLVARLNEGKFQGGTLTALSFGASGEFLYTGSNSGIIKWRWGRPQGDGKTQRGGEEVKEPTTWIQEQRHPDRTGSECRALRSPRLRDLRGSA